MSSNASMMRWYPDREPDPRPIHGWDARIDPSLKADVPFQQTDDPEGAQAWLNARLPGTTVGEPEPERLRSVPFPPENVRPPETVYADDLTGVGWLPEIDYPRITAEEIRANLEEAERVRHRIAELPDGSINGRLVDFPRHRIPVTDDPRVVHMGVETPTAYQLPDGRWHLAYDGSRPPEGSPVTPTVPRRDEPMRPHDAPAWPSPETIERPNFPRQSHAPVIEVTVCVRTLDGLEETYVIENPEWLGMTMVVETDFSEIGLDSGRLCRMPGLRELRELVISIGSPRNWRRLPTRRWQ